MGQSIFQAAGMGGRPQQPNSSGMQFANPFQKANYIMQTLTNPAAFVKQQFPDIPDNIMNDPAQILSYLQQSRGISNEEIASLQQTLNGRR